MPKESFEAWVGRSVAPIREWCVAFWASAPNRVVRCAAVAAFGIAAAGGLAVAYESAINYPTTLYETDEIRAEQAAVQDRIEVESAVALYGTLAGLGVLAAGAVAGRRES